ncbi:hypothetical protein T484DRAFT_3159016 [Baffinella frigidus]|nr:hypothetical protein T484DRAFT_3159016 [Cryptophyta sp. CCMP2293]
MALALDQVRKIASEERLKETFFNETSRVVSFAPDSPGNARINVYYSTGTVGTCLDHPRQGKTQLFRRKVDLAMLRETFRNPRVHTDRGYQRRQRQRPNGSAQEAPVEQEAPADEEAEARAQLQKLQNEAKDIAVDIANVQAIVRGFERKREEGAAALKQRRRQEQEARDADEQRRKV